MTQKKRNNFYKNKTKENKKINVHLFVHFILWDIRLVIFTLYCYWILFWLVFLPQHSMWKIERSAWMIQCDGIIIMYRYIYINVDVLDDMKIMRILSAQFIWFNKIFIIWLCVFIVWCKWWHYSNEHVPFKFNIIKLNNEDGLIFFIHPILIHIL